MYRAGYCWLCRAWDDELVRLGAANTQTYTPHFLDLCSDCRKVEVAWEDGREDVYADGEDGRYPFEG